MARETKNAVVFIDEIDSIGKSRSEGSNESESSRRVKNEFLFQMDGVGSTNEGVLLLGATNMPWELDRALLRRLEQRVYIPLPDTAARTAMLRSHFKGVRHALSDSDFVQLGKRTEGYSGSDLKTLARKTLMIQLRLSTKATHFKQVQTQEGPKYMACSPGQSGAAEMSLKDVPKGQLVEPPISRQDMESALRSSKPATSAEELGEYEKFTLEKGQDGA